MIYYTNPRLRMGLYAAMASPLAIEMLCYSNQFDFEPCRNFPKTNRLNFKKKQLAE